MCFSNQEVCNVPVPLTQVIIHPLVSLSSTMMKAFVVETWAVFTITMVYRPAEGDREYKSQKRGLG